MIGKVSKSDAETALDWGTFDIASVKESAFWMREEDETPSLVRDIMIYYWRVCNSPLGLIFSTLGGLFKIEPIELSLVRISPEKVAIQKHSEFSICDFHYSIERNEVFYELK